MNTMFFFCMQLHGHPWLFDDAILCHLSMSPNDVYFHEFLKRLNFIWIYIPELHSFWESCKEILFCSGSDKLPPVYYDFSIPLDDVLFLVIMMFGRMHARQWDARILLPNGMGWRELLFSVVQYMKWDPGIICFWFQYKQ